MPRLLNRYVLFYPMRMVGSYFSILLVWLYVRRFGEWSTYHLVLIGVLLVHPHIVFLLTRKYDYDRHKIEMRAFLLDAFYLGLVVYLTSFTLLPALILITVALSNALAVNGFGQMAGSGLALLSGLTLPMLAAGANFDPKDDVAINVACSVFLVVYFNFFAYSSYNRNALLSRSQAEIQEQKATLEIEKMRSDQLLLNIVPAAIANRLERDEAVEPETFDAVSLLAIDFRDFSRALDERGPRELLEHLTECFQAFDAIAIRHGLEKLKTMGDLYLAVVGLPEKAPSHAAAALRAALEIRDHLAEVAASRRAHGDWVLDSRIGVHSGSVVAGLVRAGKLSYDIWGRTVTSLLRIERRAEPGQVLASAATRAAAGDAFAFTPAGRLDDGDGDGGIELFAVERAAG